MYLVPTETPTLRSTTFGANPGRGRETKATCFWIFRSIAFQPTNLYTIFNTHSSRKEETIHKFFSWLAATILLCFFYVVFSSPRLIDVCCFHLVPSAQNGKFGVGMDMGCTVVFLFGAVLLLFGLHHGVQLDRIGAWGRGGGREGSNASGRSAFICFCSGHTQPPYLFYSLSSRVTFWFSTTHHYRPRGKLSRRKYKIRQIPDRTNQQPRDVMQNSACICF